MSSGLADIAFHPDGTLYAVRTSEIYILDSLTGTFYSVYTISDFNATGLSIDHRGIFYLGGGDQAGCAVATFDPATKETRVIARFGEYALSRYVNDLDFYNGDLYLMGQLPSNYTKRGIIFKVDTTGANLHDTIRIYEKWPDQNLAAYSDSCGSIHLVVLSKYINYFFPDSDSMFVYEHTPPPHIISNGSSSRTSWLGSIPPLRIDSLVVDYDPCARDISTVVTVHTRPGRPPAVEYSLDGITYQDSAVFHNVPPGIYQAFVRDEWGCSRMSDPFEIPDAMGPPGITLAAQDEHCSRHDGSITATAITGTAPFLYSLDITSWQSDPVFIGLAAGAYTVYLRDARDCIAYDSTTIAHIDTLEIISIEVYHPTCGAADGTITISASAGNGPLSYALAGGTFSDSPVFTGLSAGSYTVHVQDTTGCTGNAMVMLTSSDAPLITDIKTEDAHCHLLDGVIRITASGVGTLMYSIDGGAVSSSPVIEGLTAGTYTVIVADTAGCTAEASVRIDEIAAILIDAVDISPATCGDHNGRIGIFPSQTAHVEYSIDRISWQSDPFFDMLAAGTYSVYLRSYGVCIDSAVAAIIQYDAPAIMEIAVTAADCHGDNGIADLITSGGTLPFTYALNGQPVAGTHFTGLAPGDYVLTVSDAYGCTASAIFSVPLEESLAITSITITPAHCRSPSGSIDIYTTRTDVEFSLDGTLRNTTGSFTGLASGDHYLLLRDSDDCILDTMIHVPAMDCDIFLPNIFSPNGDGINDTFGPQSAAGIDILSFSIFDRWGNTVFSCSGGPCAWDGTIRDAEAPAGVYVYHLVFATAQGERAERKGSVTLVR